MMEQVEIRFHVNGNPTAWEPELIRFSSPGRTPTALQRITQLRQQFPSAAIITERRGEIRPRPDTTTKFRYAIYVREGSMIVNDPQGVDGVSVTRLEKQTLYSRLFTEPERDTVRAEIFKLFPNAQLTEMKHNG